MVMQCATQPYCSVSTVHITIFIEGPIGKRQVKPKSPVKARRDASDAHLFEILICRKRLATLP